MAINDGSKAQELNLFFPDEIKKKIKHLADSTSIFKQIEDHSDKPQDWFLYDTCIHLYFERLK